MTEPTTDPTAGEGLSEAEWDAITEASWTGGAKAWRVEVERIIAARESAAATRARAEALRGAADAMNVEGLRFKPGGWGSNPADQQTIDALVEAVRWLRARADALTPDAAGESA